MAGKGSSAERRLPELPGQKQTDSFRPPSRRKPISVYVMTQIFTASEWQIPKSSFCVLR